MRHRDADVSTAQPTPISPGRLWTGVLVAPAAWIAQGALGWLFGYQSCTVLTTTGARTILAGITLLALAAAVTGLWVAWTTWGRTTDERHVADIKGWDRVEFMSAGGVLVSGIFTIAIAWAGLTVVLIHECGGMR